MLVFALSQGVFWAGVASTFVMALGTAMTVAAARRARGRREGSCAATCRGGDGRLAAQVMLGLELAAAVLITVMGAVLFVGTICGLTAKKLDRLSVRRSLGRLTPRLFQVDEIGVRRDLLAA